MLNTSRASVPLELNVRALLYDVILERQSLECGRLFSLHLNKCMEMQALLESLPGSKARIDLYEDVTSFVPSGMLASRQSRLLQKCIDTYLLEDHILVRNRDRLEALKDVEKSLKNALRVLGRHPCESRRGAFICPSSSDQRTDNFAPVATSRRRGMSCNFDASRRVRFRSDPEPGSSGRHCNDRTVNNETRLSEGGSEEFGYGRHLCSDVTERAKQALRDLEKRLRYAGSVSSGRTATAFPRNTKQTYRDNLKGAVDADSDSENSDAEVESLPDEYEEGRRSPKECAGRSREEYGKEDKIGAASSAVERFPHLERKETATQTENCLVTAESQTSIIAAADEASQTPKAAEHRSTGVGSLLLSRSTNDSSGSTSTPSNSSVSLGELLSQFRLILHNERVLSSRKSGERVAEPILLSPAMRRLQVTPMAESLSEVVDSKENPLDLTDGVEPLSS